LNDRFYRMHSRININKLVASNAGYFTATSKRHSLSFAFW